MKEIVVSGRRYSLTPERRKQFAEETEEARKLAEKARKDAADDFAKKYLPIIKAMQKKGLALTEIAANLNEEGHKSRRGGPWTDQTVRQVLKRDISEKLVIKKVLASEVDEVPTKRKVDETAPKRMLGWERVSR